MSKTRKTAYLVDFSIRTRVVVDMPSRRWKDLSDEDFLRIAKAASEHLTELIRKGDDVFNIDNLTEVNEDIECPAGTLESV